MDVFNDLPKKFDEIKIRFYGYENDGKFTENVRESMKRSNASFSKSKSALDNWKNLPEKVNHVSNTHGNSEKFGINKQ